MLYVTCVYVVVVLFVLVTLYVCVQDTAENQHYLLMQSFLFKYLIITITIISHRKTRGAYFYPKGSEEFDKVVANMQSCNLPVNLLDAKQTKDSWPYLNLPDNFIAVIEEEAGILAASKAVAALQV